MAEGDKPPAGGGGKSKAYFLAKGSSVDELLVGKGEDQVSVFKEDGYSEPVELTEDEVKNAKAMGVHLTEAKP
jgi:hypothetical protein